MGKRGRFRAGGNGNILVWATKSVGQELASCPGKAEDELLPYDTIMERLLERVSFEAPDIAPARITIDAGYVRERLADLAADADTSRYIL